jgi:hypothetical protein
MEEDTKILISLIRKVMPQLIANEIMGVQLMTGPTSQLFKMRGNYVETLPTQDIEYNDSAEGPLFDEE